MSFGQSFGAFATNFASARMDQRDRAERKENAARQDRWLDIMEKQGAGGGMPALGAVPDAVGAIPVAGAASGFGRPSSNSAGASSGGLFGLLDKHEGGGSYDTLFGHSQNEGGRFAGTKITDMTLDQLADFSSPSGEYGQWVASKNKGVVATPMGRGQIVGSTLRRTAKAMGLPGDTKFTAQVQDSMINRLAMDRLRGVSDPAARRQAIRSEWVGFKSVPDAELDGAINGLISSQQPKLGAIR